MRNERVLISGAGVAGPTLAWWLVRHGFLPTIVERAPALRTGGYMIDFWGIGYQVAERMGLLDRLRQDGYRLDELRLVDAHGRPLASVEVRVFEAAAQGRFFSIMRSDLARDIYEGIVDDVETVFDDSIADMDEDADGVNVTFERGPVRRFDLVIGADGLHSRVRELAFWPRTRFEHHLGYYTAAFSAAGYPHRDEGAYVSYTMPGRQIARYALREGRSVFFFFFAHDGPLEAGYAGEDRQRRLLHDLFGSAGWESAAILAAMDRATDFYFDGVAQVRMPSWSAGRVCLVGDSAFCPSLLSGQGSAFAMAGGYLLAHELGAAAGDHELAFARYEERLRPFVEATQRGAERSARWFAPRTTLGLSVRTLVTRAMNLPWIGEILARRTLGDRLDLPS